MFERLQAIAEKMSDAIPTGDAISRVGQVGGGTGLGVAVGSGVSLVDLFQYMPHTWPEWAAFFSIICVIPMIVRSIFTSIARGVIWIMRLKNGSTNSK
ncbi:membrane protein [Klebsiella phage VLCpiS13d]|uniref:membrane protein n=1 Tax=Klebsiella phage VLCpiS13d TaxID=2874888 RepID=UPI00233EFDE6|nr:membrane protein [Klebsiella phage VLCpiS13d]UVX31703.1 hypothetical protein S13d_00039 [Klebsiella phage VLCpiS13d]